MVSTHLFSLYVVFTFMTSCQIRYLFCHQLQVSMEHHKWGNTNLPSNNDEGCVASSWDESKEVIITMEARHEQESSLSPRGYKTSALPLIELFPHSSELHI